MKLGKVLSFALVALLVVGELAHAQDTVASEEDFDPRFEEIVPELEGSDLTWSGRECRGSRCQRAPEVIDPVLSEQTATSAAAINENFKDYSTDPRILRLIEEARENLRTRSYVERRVNPVTKKVSYMTFCYRAVKEALLESGLVRHYLPSGEARFAVEDLRRAGFRNLLDHPNYAQLLTNSPRLAPKGTVLVYRNNPNYVACSGCPRPSSAGHTEIKTQDAGRDGYISVSETHRATYGYRIPQHRLLIGVMYKP